jgi:hypothetical protein
VWIGARHAFFPPSTYASSASTRAAQRVTVQPDPGVLQRPVPQVQQVHPVTAQLARVLGGRDALDDAAEDQDDLHGPPLHAPEGRPWPDVEDAMAPAATITVHYSVPT